jgi:phospholipid N-methyltransferase
VIELGPGTGVFTEAILARGIPPERVAAIEASTGFAAALATRHPCVTVIVADAARVRHVTPFGPAGAEAIVCGLPLLSMPPGKVLRIISGGFAALRAGGAFRLFTYGLRCPISATMRDRLGIVARRTAFVAVNMPPASVFSLERKEVL